MPYVLKKFPNGLYKVGLKNGGKMSNGRYYLSNKYLTRTQAVKQKRAVELNEKNR